MLTSLHIQRYQGWQDSFLRDIGAGLAAIEALEGLLETEAKPEAPTEEGREAVATDAEM